MIWQHAILEHEPIFCPCALPPLIQTCYQVRQEAGGVFFGMNAFGMMPDMDKLLEQTQEKLDLFHWLEHLENVRLLRHMCRAKILHGICKEFCGRTFELPDGRETNYFYMDITLGNWDTGKGCRGSTRPFRSKDKRALERK